MGQEVSTASRAAAVRAMFDGIAARYDVLNRLLSFGIDRYWRRAAIRAVQRSSPREVLDLACGTCDMTRILLKRLPTCAKIYAVDPSSQMLLRARAKPWPRSVRAKVQFVESGAESLPLPDGAVDAVMISFGIRNFADRISALREIHRVLRPNGHLVILEFSTPHLWLFKRLYRFYFTRCLPLLGGFISRSFEAYRYLPHSVYAFPEGMAFVQELRNAGFDAPSYRRLSGGIATIYEAKKNAPSCVVTA